MIPYHPCAINCQSGYINITRHGTRTNRQPPWADDGYRSGGDWGQLPPCGASLSAAYDPDAHTLTALQKLVGATGGSVSVADADSPEGAELKGLAMEAFANLYKIRPGTDFWLSAPSWASLVACVTTTTTDAEFTFYVAVTNDCQGRRVAVACAADPQAILINEQLFTQWRGPFGAPASPRAHGKRVWCKFGSRTLLAEDAYSLALEIAAGSWSSVNAGQHALINDQIINTFAAVLTQEHGDKGKFLILNSFFVGKLLDDIDLERWTKKVGWAGVNDILFLHNPGGCHWVLYAIPKDLVLADKVTVLYKDSIEGPNGRDVLAKLKGWYNKTVAGSDSERLWAIGDDRGPQQVGSYDCGIFVMVAMYMMATKERFDFSQDMVAEARMWAVSYIFKGATAAAAAAAADAKATGGAAAAQAVEEEEEEAAEIVLESPQSSPRRPIIPLISMTATGWAAEPRGQQGPVHITQPGQMRRSSTSPELSSAAPTAADTSDLHSAKTLGLNQKTAKVSSNMTSKSARMGFNGVPSFPNGA